MSIQSGFQKQKHTEMYDTNNSVQPYLITMQVKNKDFYVMRTTNAQPPETWHVYKKVLGVFEGEKFNSLFHFEVLSSCLKQPAVRTKEKGIQGGNSCRVDQTSRCSCDIWETCILTKDHLSCL